MNSSSLSSNIMSCMKGKRDEMISNIFDQMQREKEAKSIKSYISDERKISIPHHRMPTLMIEISTPKSDFVGQNKNISKYFKYLKIFQRFQKISNLSKIFQKYFKCPTTKLLGYKVVSRLRIVSGVFEFFSPQVRRCLMCLVFNLKHEHFVNIAGCICIP